MKKPPARRITKSYLSENAAKFTLEGLRFHFAKLNQYTNPTGGALDKIPLNTKHWTQLVYAQYKAKPASQKRIFLRKKAQYHVADHLLGIGKRAYWTGSTRKMTLLGLDIDDHESKDHAEVHANSEASLRLFVELTGLTPVACSSPGGINAYLICQKGDLTTEVINKSWHGLVRAVEWERKRMGLAAKIECKGHARIFGSKSLPDYGGVQFKDPLYAANPTDDQIVEFWDKLEAQQLEGARLAELLNELELKSESAIGPSSEATAVLAANAAPVHTDRLTLKTYAGHWAKQCREWAIHGLPEDDSITCVIDELSLWLFYIELWNVPSESRLDQVVELLTTFCLLKHNGFVTRINNGEVDAVVSHIKRIAISAITHATDNAKYCFANIRNKQEAGSYAVMWKLAPLMETVTSNISLCSSFFPVKITECCSSSETPHSWVPKPVYWRNRAEFWSYTPDDTPLPQSLNDAIDRFYFKNELKRTNAAKRNILRFLNHLWANSGKARLGVESLKKLGFSNYSARQHISHLEKMGVIEVLGYCPVAGLSKGYQLREPARKLFEAERQGRR